MIKSIYNFKLLSPTLATGGQPDEKQLQELSKAGYEVVINLGLSDASYSVKNEKELIETEGMQYIHIPVDFDAPETQKYFEFARLFKSVFHKKVFVHCAVNKRVSVFLALFNITEGRMSFEKAVDDMKLVWDPNEVWRTYMEDIIKNFDRNSESGLIAPGMERLQGDKSIY